MKACYKFLSYMVATVTLFGGCGGEKGGDHVPVGKTYAVQSIPLGATARTIVPVEYSTEVLGKFVHVAENYRLCLIREQFVDAELLGFQAYLSGKTSAINQYGIEALINYSFATLQSFDGNKPRFSARVSLQVVWNSDGLCDFLIGKVGSADFPFNHEDFSGRRRVLFDAGQLTTDAGAASAVPVGYLVGGPSADDKVHLQKLVASYLGFADSGTAASYINANASSATASSWNVVDSSNQLLAGEDSLKIYSFAVAWHDILKPQDLDRFHYYEDSLSRGGVVSDPLLVVTSAGAIPTFIDLPGNRYLHGARKLVSDVQLCFKDDSGSGVTAEMMTAWTSFLSPANESGIHGKLHLSDASFNVSSAVVDVGCQLWVAFRSESQYPFSTKKANGFYAHEGTVAGSNNIASPVPVIYINATNLSLSTDPILMTAARHVAAALQHEYAHFLGFRHSSDRNSLQAPAGTGTGWTEGDKAIFAEYLKYYK